MKRKFLLLFLLYFPSPTGLQLHDGGWLIFKTKNYSINYKESDKTTLAENTALLLKGFNAVKDFFGEPYKKKFEVFIHPDRKSLDSTWSKDWNSPGFTSECWMVASGVAKRIDILSPKTWDSTACEHPHSDKAELQRVITHELFHVYHGQFNTSSDFGNVEGIDWFVEGLATYASGQCDEGRVSMVKEAILKDKTPATLDKFWTGKLKYGFSGTMVMYIDKKWGRKKLRELLQYNKKQQILEALNISEASLLDQWRDYVKKVEIK